MQATAPQDALGVMDWRTLCSSLVDVVKSDNPSLLREYLEQDPSRLRGLDLEKNSLLMILLMGKAVKAVETLLAEYSEHVDVQHKNAQDRTALHYACILPNAKLVISSLLTQGAELLAVDAFGWTPIHIAISTHNIQTVDLISRLGNCNFNNRSLWQPLFADQSNSPLHLAARSTSEMLKHIAVHVGDFDSIDDSGQTALHHCMLAIDPYKNTEYLLGKRVDVNVLDSHGRTALCIACQNGNVALAELLLDAGAKPNLGKISPLILAYLFGAKAVAQKLVIHDAEVNCKIGNISLYDICLAVDDTEFLQAIAIAKTSETTENIGRCTLPTISKTKKTLPPSKTKNPSKSELAKKIAFEESLTFEKRKTELTLDEWENRDLQGKTALFHLCEKGTLLQCHRLFVLGLDSETKDTQGNTLLHAALANSDPLVLCFLIRHFKGLINQANAFGETPLHIAVRRGNLLAVKLLLQFGATTNAIDKQKNTPLHMVAHMQSIELTDYFYVINLLLARGGNLEAQNLAGKTPVMCAQEIGQMIVFDYLLRKGANANAFDSEKTTMLIRACELNRHTQAEQLIIYGANQNVKGKTTPLIASCKVASLGLVTLLLNPRACPKDQKSVTADPNRWVGDISPLGVTLELLKQDKGDVNSPSFPILRHLIEHGVDVDRKVSFQGKKITPLIYALDALMPKVALLLIEKGADVDKKTTRKRRPVEVAAENGFPEVVAALLQRRAKIPLDRFTKMKNLTQPVRDALKNSLPVSDASSAVSPPKLKAPRDWDSVRRGMEEPPESPAPSSSRMLIPFDSAPHITRGMQQLAVVSLPSKSLFKENTLWDHQMRKARMLASSPLLFQKSRTLPGSICRLGNTVAISLSNVSIINKNTVFEATDRDERARELLRSLFKNIHALQHIQIPADTLEKRLKLLTTMDGINDEEVETLDIYTADGKLQQHNRDLIPIKLLTKEAACMAIVPVQTQIRLYSEANAKKIQLHPKPNRDQWEQIDLELIEEGWIAHAKTTVGIDAREGDDESLKFAAKLDVEARLFAIEATGQLSITLKRTNLVFETTNQTIRDHIVTALDSDITYETHFT